MNKMQKEILVAQIINKAKDKPMLNYPEDYLDLTLHQETMKELDKRCADLKPIFRKTKSKEVNKNGRHIRKRNWE